MQKKNIFKGDIVVCIKRYMLNITNVGDIGKLQRIDSHFPKYQINSSYCEDVRLATIEEIEAYNLGCTNIADLDKYINKKIEYEIY